MPGMILKKIKLVGNMSLADILDRWVDTWLSMPITGKTFSAKKQRKSKSKKKRSVRGKLYELLTTKRRGVD